MIIDGISMNSHIDPDKMEVFFVPFENISSNWNKGPDLSCKMTIDDGEDDNGDENGDIRVISGDYRWHLYEQSYRSR